MNRLLKYGFLASAKPVRCIMATMYNVLALIIVISIDIYNCFIVFYYHTTLHNNELCK